MARYLRSEARPAKYADLDSTQREAFGSILQMIGEAVDGVSMRGTQAVPSDKVEWLSTNRSSRTVVLSGGRGTGKTTLLASLIKATTSQEEYLIGHNIHESLHKGLKKIQRRIVWLEPMDMETMPEKVNLLASILVRIEDAIARVGNVGRNGILADRPDYLGEGLLDAGTEFHSVMLDLKRIQNAIALAWEGNLQAHGSQIDPDAYAVELLRSEHARLSVNTNLDQVLEMIARKIFWKANIQNPLFILPIDDLDLNPLACLELLRFLRMISSPRIFNIVLGDIHIAEVVMNLKLSGDLAQAAAQGVQSPDLLSLDTEEVAAVAGEISANAMRKLIPYNQRIQLEKMDVLEALQFKPLDSQGDDATLYDFLAQYPMSFGRPPEVGPAAEVPPPERAFKWSLKDFLISPTQSWASLYAPTDGAKVDLEPEAVQTPMPTRERIAIDLARSRYTGLQFLKGTPREASDLWFTINRLVQFKNEQQPSHTANATFAPDKNESLHDALVAAMAKHCRAVLQEERGVSPAERIQFKESIRLNPRGQWELGQMPLRVLCETVAMHEIEAAADSERSYPSKQKSIAPHTAALVQANKAMHWAVTVGSSFRRGDVWETPTDGDTRGVELSADAAGAIVFLHDLLALGPRGGMFKSPLLFQKPDFYDIAATVWQRDANRRVALAWPLPLCKSFWEFDMFSHVWEDALTLPDPSEALGADWAAFVWISVGTALVDRSEPVRSSSIGYADPTHWQAIVSRLVNLTTGKRDKHFKDDVLEWLTRVFLMIMPETGLPDSLYRLCAKSNELRDYWNEHRQAILPRRIRRLSTMVTNGFEDLAIAKADWTRHDFQELSPMEDEILSAAGTASTRDDPEPASKKETRTPPRGKKRRTTQ